MLPDGTAVIRVCPSVPRVLQTCPPPHHPGPVQTYSAGRPLLAGKNWPSPLFHLGRNKTSPGPEPPPSVPCSWLEILAITRAVILPQWSRLSFSMTMWQKLFFFGSWNDPLITETLKRVFDPIGVHYERLILSANKIPSKILTNVLQLFKYTKKKGFSLAKHKF